MYLLCSSSSRLSKSFKVLFFPFFFFKYTEKSLFDVGRLPRYHVCSALNVKRLPTDG